MWLAAGSKEDWKEKWLFFFSPLHIMIFCWPHCSFTMLQGFLTECCKCIVFFILTQRKMVGLFMSTKLLKTANFLHVKPSHPGNFVVTPSCHESSAALCDVTKGHLSAPPALVHSFLEVQKAKWSAWGLSTCSLTGSRRIMQWFFSEYIVLYYSNFTNGLCTISEEISI